MQVEWTDAGGGVWLAQRADSVNAVVSETDAEILSYVQVPPCWRGGRRHARLFAARDILSWRCSLRCRLVLI